MAESVTLKRIVDMVAQTDVDDSVYIIIDSQTGGPKRYPAGSLICSIAPIFDAATAYVAGKYCNYNGKLYEFTADHAAGSWTGSDVTEVTLGDVLSDLKDDLIAYVNMVELTFAKENASGTNVFVLDNPIPAGMEITLTNRSVDTTFVAIFIDVDRGVHNLGSTAPGETKTDTFNKPIVEFRAAITSGSTINASLTYGGNLINRVSVTEEDILDIEKSRVVNGVTPINGWNKRNYNTGSGAWEASLNTLSTSTALTANASLMIGCKPGYKFAIRRWNAEDRTKANFESDTGWIESGNLHSVSEGEIFDIA